MHEQGAILDVVLLSCKAYDLEEAMAAFAPAVGPETLILPLLNGMHHLDLLDARFGASSVLGGQCLISATLDALGGSALMVALGEKHPHESAEQVMHRFLKMGTIDLRVDFLRQGMGKHFIGSAEVTRLGGRVGSTQMRLVNDEGTLIATAAAAYIVS